MDYIDFIEKSPDAQKDKICNGKSEVEQSNQRSHEPRDGGRKSPQGERL